MATWWQEYLDELEGDVERRVEPWWVTQLLATEQHLDDDGRLVIDLTRLEAEESDVPEFSASR